MSKEKMPGVVGSLRWLANQFPWNDKPADNADRMFNAIHAYCSMGATKIEELYNENQELKAELEKLKNTDEK